MAGSGGYGRPLLAVFAGATAISFSAIFFRLSGVTPLTGTFYRMVYALPPLALIWMAGRRRDARPWGDRLMAMLAGALLSADVVAWHTSIEMIGAGLATLIANSQVVIVPVVTWLLFGERVPRPILLAMPVVMVGLALITGLGRADTFGDRPLLGVGLAVVAAALYSGFLIGYRRSNRTLAPPAGPLLDAVIGAAVVASLAGLIFGDLDLAPSWPAHGWLIALALGAQVIGWLGIGYALPRLPAAHTSFAILLQPSLTLAWGALIFDERASLVQAAGVALVLAGILMVSLRRSVIPTPSAA
ncbi:MAG: DMT family transporter [Acidimicrobiia bacterium]|nr:DMT family transporter [Acidimicrobiia bacterium]